MMKNNNFGALRLLFACFVIISHSAELVDGNRNNEILVRLFGSISLGEISVDGFFLISGYLITQSFQNSSSVKSFLIKRILRIYPGFAIASLISIFVFATCSIGFSFLGDFTLIDWLKIPIRILILEPPWVNNVFTGIAHNLNGSLWTIRFEFLCYLTIPILFSLSIKRTAYLSLVVFFIITFMFMHFGYVFELPFGLNSFTYTRFFLAFGVGGCFYQFKDRVIWDNRISIFCFVLLYLSMLNVVSAELGFIIFGGYLLFNFAFNFKNKHLSAIGVKNDISYGVYLYAWPFQCLVIKFHTGVTQWSLSFYTLIFSFIMGYASWLLVEKPFMEMKKSFK